MFISDTQRHHDIYCPYCGKKMDSSNGVDHDSGPSEGAVTICIDCTRPSIFNEKLELEKPTAEELVDLYKDPRIRQVQAAIRSVKAKMN